MARPERKNVDYFPHPVKHGKKMFFIETKYANDGYSVWFKLLEQLGDADHHYLNLKDEAQAMYLAAKCHVPEEKLLSIVSDIARLGGFDRALWEAEKIVYSFQFTESIKDAYNRRSNKLLQYEGLLVHLQGLGILKPGYCKHNAYRKPQRIGEDIKGEDSKADQSAPASPELWFDEFWKAYPKKVGKGAARKAWGKVKQPATVLPLILKALEWQKASEQWTKDKGQYIPNPATYLNETRWEDSKGLDGIEVKKGLWDD